MLVEKKFEKTPKKHSFFGLRTARPEDYRTIKLKILKNIKLKKNNIKINTKLQTFRSDVA